MKAPIVLALGLALLAWLLAGSEALRKRWPEWHWYPAAAMRVFLTWKKVAQLNDLSVTHKPTRALLGGLVVKGAPVRLVAPRISLPHPTPNGLALTVRLHPGQTPVVYLAAADALAHAWRVYAVRVTSPERGIVQLVATGTDPLADPRLPAASVGERLMSARVGVLESGRPWVMDLRAVPHWLVVGATQSGKSTLLARLVAELAPQPVALVGIDCKGGMELGLFACRLSALTTCRPEAVTVLGGLVIELQNRMSTCRAAGVRNIWELPEGLRPAPVVVLVDELAELYLTDGTKAGKAEAEQCSVYLVRIAQLGAALGVHLVVAGQRVGSDLGPGVTALRAQLSGRICHRVNDSATAEMVLGDLNPDAVTVAQTITADEKGVAVVGGEADGWSRARSHLTTVEEARRVAERHEHLTPPLPCLTAALEDAAGGGSP
jgi:S-DNA-T family DNA segregation ATPase FtsK/SpoIIIE